MPTEIIIIGLSGKKRTLLERIVAKNWDIHILVKKDKMCSKKVICVI